MYRYRFRSFIYVVLACFILSQNSSSKLAVQAKTCVATAENRYLCTDDATKARAHEWKNQPDNKIDFDSLDLGEEQEIDGTPEEMQAVQKVLSNMKYYFETEVLVKPEYDSVLGRCVNNNKLCAFWTSVGECESNREFMLSNCAATCRMCLSILSKK